MDNNNVNIGAKRPADSETTQVQLLMPEHLNGQNRLFGGRLMEWIDVVAGVTARRHSGCEVTTARVDRLEFKQGAKKGETVFLRGRVTWVGRTSMEVRVDTYTESLKGEHKHINRAYLVMVALCGEGQPCEVPRLILETDEEKEEYAQAVLRAEERKRTR